MDWNPASSFRNELVDEHQLLEHQFRDAMANTASSVAIVAVRHANIECGATVSSFLSVSLNPPIAMVSLRRSSSLAEKLVATGEFGVTVLSEGQQAIAEALSRPDKPSLAEVGIEPGYAVPIICGGSASFLLTLRQMLLVGDHYIVIGDVVSARADWRPPLLYQSRRYGSFVTN